MVYYIDTQGRKVDPDGNVLKDPPPNENPRPAMQASEPDPPAPAKGAEDEARDEAPVVSTATEPAATPGKPAAKAS